MSLTHHEVPMLLECCLRDGLGQDIGRLIECINLMHGDKAPVDVCSKEVVLHVDAVFGMGAHLWYF
jgi:hypothetical protein